MMDVSSIIQVASCTETIMEEGRGSYLNSRLFSFKPAPTVAKMHPNPKIHSNPHNHLGRSWPKPSAGLPSERTCPAAEVWINWLFRGMLAGKEGQHSFEDSTFSVVARVSDAPHCQRLSILSTSA